MVRAEEGLTKDLGTLEGAAAWLNGVSGKRRVGVEYVCLMGGFEFAWLAVHCLGANGIDALGLGDDDDSVCTIGSRGQWR